MTNRNCIFHYDSLKGDNIGIQRSKLYSDYENLLIIDPKPSCKTTDVSVYFGLLVNIASFTNAQPHLDCTAWEIHFTDARYGLEHLN